MNTHEDKIIAALHRFEEDQDIDSLSGILKDMMRKQSVFLRVFPMIGMVVWIGLAVFAVVRFYGTQNVQEWIAYATLFIVALIAVAMIKLWLFLVWVRNSLMREIKRLELRTMSVSSVNKSI